MLIRVLDVEGKQHNLQPRDLHALTYARSTQTTRVALRTGKGFDIFMEPTRLLRLLEA